MIKCVRCGACCFTGPCGFGNDKGKIGCSELVVNKDKTTSCGLLLKGKIKPSDIGINGSGCVYQKIPEYYKEKIEEINSLKCKYYGN